MTLTYKVTRQGYSIGSCCIEFPDPKNHGNKKVHRCSLSTTRDRKDPIQGHVTLTYKVTRQGYSVGLCCIEFPDPKNQGNKKSSLLWLVYNQIEIGTDVGNVMTTWRHVKYMQLHMQLSSCHWSERYGTSSKNFVEYLSKYNVCVIYNMSVISSSILMTIAYFCDVMTRRHGKTNHTPFCAGRSFRKSHERNL